MQSQGEPHKKNKPEIGIPVIPISELQKIAADREEEQRKGVSVKTLSTPKKKTTGTNDSKRTVELAVVDLFAGLRTSHVAAASTKHRIVVLSHAAECCELANRLAKKTIPHTDVAALTEEWATVYIK